MVLVEAFKLIGRLLPDTDGKVNWLFDFNSFFFVAPCLNREWIFILGFRCRLLAILERSFSFQANFLNPTNLIHLVSQAT